MSDLIRSCFARAKTSLSLYWSSIALMYLHHRIVVFSFKIRSRPPQQRWQVKEDHDDNLSPSDKNQDKEEEHEDKEGLFDFYSNRSGTAEGHTKKGFSLLEEDFRIFIQRTAIDASTIQALSNQCTN
jgi:hypothetical protein